MEERREFSFEKGTLLIDATDRDGAAEGTAYVESRDDAGERWKSVASAKLDGGKATFPLVPGAYRARVEYAEAKPKAEQVLDGIAVEDGEETRREVRFEKGALRVAARDHDGSAEGTVYAARRDKATGRWKEVASSPLRTGFAEFALTPGTYRARVYYKEAKPEPTVVREDIEIADGSAAVEEFYFEKGEIRVAAVDAAGPAKATAYILRRGEASGEWRTIDYGAMKDGRVSFSLVPDTYRVRFVYRGTEPEATWHVGGIQLIDRHSLSESCAFLGGDAPPTSAPSGPSRWATATAGSSRGSGRSSGSRSRRRS